MKDFAHKLHKPQQPKPWTDVAREMTENIIFVIATVLALVNGVSLVSISMSFGLMILVL